MKKGAVQKKVECGFGKLDYWDMRLVKLSVASAMLVLVSGFENFRNWVASVQWYWFFIVMIIFAIRPFRRAYCKKI